MGAGPRRGRGGALRALTLSPLWMAGAAARQGKPGARPGRPIPNSALGGAQTSEAGVWGGALGTPLEDSLPRFLSPVPPGVRGPPQTMTQGGQDPKARTHEGPGSGLAVTPSVSTSCSL